MANELTLNLSVSFSKGLASAFKGINQFVDVAGSNYVTGTLATSTSDATIDDGDIGTLGWVVLLNLSTTASENILVGDDGTNYPVIMEPGEPAIFRCNGGTVHVKSSTGTPSVEYLLIED